MNSNTPLSPKTQLLAWLRAFDVNDDTEVGSEPKLRAQLIEVLDQCQAGELLPLTDEMSSMGEAPLLSFFVACVFQWQQEVGGS